MNQIDPAKAELFAGTMRRVLNDATLALMISIGHQTGLFDAMAALAPATSLEIAAAARLSERYVREWLGAMIAGRVVEYDAAARTYRLPAEHAAALTRAAGADNLATRTQYVALLGNVEQAIVEAFRKGGGVGHAGFPRLRRLQAEETRRHHEATLIDRTLPLVSGLVPRLHAGIDVLDVGCGDGHAVHIMAAGFRRSRFVGIDLSEEAVAAGRAEAARRRSPNAHFEARDAAALAGPPRFDFISAFEAVHDQAQPASVLSGIAESLRDDGVFLMVDIAASSDPAENIDHPLGPTLYTMSTMHCMTVSLAEGGEGLGSMWGERRAQQMLADAGFGRVEVHHVEGDVMRAYYVCRKR